jgi:hypothetical protein
MSRRITTIEQTTTTTRLTPGATPAPPVVTFLRITYTRTPGGAARNVLVHNRAGAVALTNIQRFNLESAVRAPPTRTCSLPPTKGRRPRPITSKDSLWDKLRQHKHSAARLLRQGRDKLLQHRHLPRRLLHEGQAKIRQGVAAIRRDIPPLRLRTVVVIAATAYLAANSLSYNLQPKPVYLEQYSAFPTWMYADSPDQILGFHEPLFPHALQPYPAVHKQYRTMLKRWASDKATLHKDKNGKYPGREHMAQIHFRYIVAHDEYHKREPYINFGKDDWFNMTIPGDDLPHFKPRCVCTMTLAASNQFWHAVTPFTAHAGSPRTSADISTHCPCSFSSAILRLKKGFSDEFLPPPLPQFYEEDDELAKRRDLGSWWLRRYGKSRDLASWTKEEIAELVKEGWLMPEDKEYLWGFETDVDPDEAPDPMSGYGPSWQQGEAFFDSPFG